MAFTRFYVDPPAVKPIPFGLFSVADVRDMNDAHWSGGGIEMENPVGCGPTGVAIQPCETPEAKDVFIVPGYPNGDPYTAYAQYKCSGPVDFPDGQRFAMQALAAGEERSVEGALMTQLLADATDLTPGGAALPAENGVALLEGIWGQYGGPMQPTFHLDRTVAHLAWKAIDRHGNHLETELGALVSAGSGYFEPAYDETNGTSWIVVTGPLVVMRGTAQSHKPYFIQDPLDNEWVALAERTFAWAYLCGAFKVQVNSLSGAGGL